MATKEVTDRQKTAAYVEAAVNTHGVAAARIVEEELRLFAVAEKNEAGEATTPEPSVEELLQRLGTMLHNVSEKLVAADEAHLKELDDDPEPRRRRDAVAAEVYTEVARLRTVARGLYGSEVATELLGVDGKTSKDPLLLHRQAARILERFTNSETVFPAIEVAGAGLSPEAWAEQLRPQVERLGAALAEVHRQRRAAEATLAAKKEARERFDRTYQGVARTVEGVFGLAGLKDLAGRVRPRRRKTFRQEAAETGDAVSLPGAVAFVEGVVPPLAFVAGP